MTALLLALVTLLAPPLTPGRYRVEADGGPIELVLGADGAAVFGGAPVRWQQSGDVLTLSRAAGAPYVLTIREVDGQRVLDGPPFGRLRLEPLPPAPPGVAAPAAPTAPTAPTAPPVLAEPPIVDPAPPTPLASPPPPVDAPIVDPAPPTAEPADPTPPIVDPKAPGALPTAEPQPPGERPRPLALIGAWRHRASGGALVLRLYGDGRYALEQPDTPATTGRWDADGERLTLTPAGGEPLTYTARRDGEALVVGGGDLPAAVRFVPDGPR